MDNKRLSQVLSKYLPEELFHEILSQLPVKSLLRFRRVSKSWLSLISNPDFCLTHLKNFKNNRDETHLLVVKGKPKYFIVRCSNNFEINGETPVILPPRYREADLRIKCSVNGLVLLEMCYGRDNSVWTNDLMVWNPSIRKYHVIPPLPISETCSDGYFQQANIGLGYDPLVKDYKLVNLIRGNANSLPLVAIYTLGVGSWKISPFLGNEISMFEWGLGFICKDVVYLWGNLYFIPAYLEGEALELVAFDLPREEFCSISMPDCVSNQSWSSLVCIGCSLLALFYFDESISIWVLDIESMCWTQPYLKKNHDILTWWAEIPAEFNLGTISRFEHWCQLVKSYNLESKEERIRLLQKLDANLEICEADGYIESLVLLK